MGEANQKGNRFFEFDLINKVIIYKPFKGKKIILELCNRKDKFEKELVNAINNKDIALTVSFNKDKICLSYDEAALAGFSINKTERKNEVKELTKYLINNDSEKKLIINKIYTEYYNRLRDRQLKNKIKNRYIGIDLNPEYIGYSIIDKISDTEFKIITSGCYNFKNLCNKSNKSSDSLESIKLNNKRKHERKEVICDLFKLMKHYKV